MMRLGILKSIRCWSCGFDLGFDSKICIGENDFIHLSCATQYGRVSRLWVHGEVNNFYLIRKSALEMFNREIERTDSAKIALLEYKNKELQKKLDTINEALRGIGKHPEEKE